MAEAGYQAQLYNSKGHTIGKVALQAKKGKQTLAFPAEYRSTQILYLRILNKQSGATIATQKVLAKP
jgi:hypothetical protein